MTTNARDPKWVKGGLKFWRQILEPKRRRWIHATRKQVEENVRIFERWARELGIDA